MRILLIVACSAIAAAAHAAEPDQFPGPKPKGFLLPNGWTITPAHYLNQQLDTVWLAE